MSITHSADARGGPTHATEERVERRVAGAEAALRAMMLTARQNEQRFRQILDAIPDLVLVKDPDSAIVWANAAFRDYIGMSGDGVGQGASARHMLEEMDEQNALDDAKVFATGQPLVIPDQPVMRFDGEVRRFQTAKSPIFDDSGKVVSLVAVCHDLTDRTRLESQLRLADRMASVGTLAAGIAHEINTPVQFVSDSVHFLRDAAADVLVLIGNLERLRRLVISGAPLEEQLEVAAAAGREAQEADLPYLSDNVPKAFERCLDGLERVATIVSSMKEFAHPPQREMAPTDLNRALQATLVIARSEYKFVADVETELGPLPPVSCYISEINQVLLNIIVNAAHAIGDVVKGTDRRGTIRVKTEQRGGQVVIAVSDTGGGIDSAIAGRIFEMFFTTKPVGRGTGQGLALAWTVVTEMHGGELRFESKLGEGSTFFITLPIDGKQTEATAS